MNRFSSSTRVLLPVLLLVLAMPALGQDRDRRGRGGRGFGGRGGFGQQIDKARLVAVEQVQKEIKVTEEQKGKIDGVLADYREASRGLFSDLRDRFQDDREAAMAEMNKRRTELAKKTEKKIDAALSKEQVKRLDEIVLQQKGVEGLTDAPVVAALKLNEEQVGKIKAVFRTQAEKRQALFRDRGGDREERREKTEALRKETETAALAVLTKEQSEQFATLKGAAFELDRSALRRGGFGRGGRDGGGRRGGREGGARGGERRRPPVDTDDL